MPDRTANPAKVKRHFSFDTKNGAWVVNGNFFNPSTISAYPEEGTAESGHLSSGGGWSHPVHIHHEEFQILNRNGKFPAIDGLSRKDVVRIGQAAQGDFGDRGDAFFTCSSRLVWRLSDALS